MEVLRSKKIQVTVVDGVFMVGGERVAVRDSVRSNGVRLIDEEYLVNLLQRGKLWIRSVNSVISGKVSL